MTADAPNDSPNLGPSADPNPAPLRTRLARRILIDATVMIAIGVVLAFVGPFGTYTLPLSVRIVLWPAFCGLGYLLYRPMGIVVDRMHRALDLPRPALWTAACLVSTIPMSACLYILDRLPAPLVWPSLDLALAYYFNVLVIGGTITAIMQLLGRNETQRRAAMADAVSEPRAQSETRQPEFRQPETRQPEAGTETATQENAAPEPFLDRLPPALGRDLLALEMEDHYVRAHTALGSDLVLMRMRDAMTELDGIDGAQVHRSWWVARAAVEGVRREGRNLRLRLTGELEAPVARGTVAELKAQGWF